MSDKLRVDGYLFNILDEYDGFKYKSTLSEDECRLIMAQYALDCLHDKKLAEEAFEICKPKGD
jgi:hypothetical protein